MDTEYLENYIWIYAHTNDLSQSVVIVNLVNLATEVNFNKYFYFGTSRIRFSFFYSITVDG